MKPQHSAALVLVPDGPRVVRLQPVPPVRDLDDELEALDLEDEDDVPRARAIIDPYDGLAAWGL